MSVLGVRDGYRLWAPRYDVETAVSHLENDLVRRIGPSTTGRMLLDAGCGTARRLREAGAALAIGVDCTRVMLSHARGVDGLAAADLRALPFSVATFDVVWCRLAIGHVAELSIAYEELGRVCRPGGHVVVTDFHPDAVAAGHRRTFRDTAGLVHEIEHYVHRTEDHTDVADEAGLDQIGRADGQVGPLVKQFYRDGGRLDAYQAQRGLRLVLAVVFRKRS